MSDSGRSPDGSGSRASHVLNADNDKVLPASSVCPICGRETPHNHSAFEVAAFRQIGDNEARNYGLITFRCDEAREMLRRRV